MLIPLGLLSIAFLMLWSYGGWLVLTQNAPAAAQTLSLVISGQTATGHVVDRRRVIPPRAGRGSNAPQPTIYYRFYAVHGGDGSEQEGAFVVSPDYFAQLNAGDDVDVTYLSSEPSVSRLNQPRWQDNLSFLPMLLSQIAACVVGLGILVAYPALMVTLLRLALRSASRAAKGER